MTRPGRSPAVLTAAVLIGVIGVLYFARDVLIPLALAITFALVLSPAVAWLQKLHIPRFVGTLLAMAMCLTIASAVTYVIVSQLVDVVNRLPSYRENIDSKLNALRAPHRGALGRAAENVKQLGNELTPPKGAVVTPPARGAGRVTTPSPPLAVQVVEPVPNEISYIQGITRPFLAPLAKIGIVLVFTVFLLVEQGDLRNRVFRLAARGETLDFRARMPVTTVAAPTLS